MTRPFLLGIALVSGLAVWRDARRAGVARPWAWGVAVLGFWAVMLPAYVWSRLAQRRDQDHAEIIQKMQQDARLD